MMVNRTQIPASALRQHVRFGSKGDMRTAQTNVCFSPNSDHESRHATNGHVRFTPESGHSRAQSKCLLYANSGHSATFIYSSPLEEREKRIEPVQ
jgi:hypothetical protein